MTTIEELRDELEAKGIVFFDSPTDGGKAEEQDLLEVIGRLRRARAKEARENALYAPQFFNESYPNKVTSFSELLRTCGVETLQEALVALHEFSEKEKKYTGLVITGPELGELLGVKG